jgi:hypothetical protein
MRNVSLSLELDVDAASVGDLGALAFEWFDDVSRIALAEPRTVLEDGGDVPVALPFADPASWNPAGAPVRLQSMVLVSSRRAKAFDAKALPWLRERLGEGQERASLYFWLTAGSEPDSPNVWYPSLDVHRPGESPGWMRLGAYVRESIFLDRARGAEAQRLWLGILRSWAERVNPGFGQIEYGYDDFGTTGLEYSLPPDIALEDRVADYTVAQCRRYLRGYSWLTVVPSELAAQLGGAAGLRRTGTFVEVAELRAGGLWLLATGDYREYGPEQVDRVFRALAPVLRPGRPVSKSYVIDGLPQRVVFEDAVDSQER